MKWVSQPGALSCVWQNCWSRYNRQGKQILIQNKCLFLWEQTPSKMEEVQQYGLATMRLLVLDVCFVLAFPRSRCWDKDLCSGGDPISTSYFALIFLDSKSNSQDSIAKLVPKPSYQFFFRFIYLFERESKHEGGAGRRGKERDWISGRLPAEWGAQCRAWSHGPKPKPRVRAQLTWATHMPPLFF